MKTIDVRITFRHEDFTQPTAQSIHEALCRAYPLCSESLIVVEDITRDPADLLDMACGRNA